MPDLKDTILGYIDKYGVVGEGFLFSTLGSAPYDIKLDDILKAISELVQAGEIKRFEYTKKDGNVRCSFYMSNSTRLMY